jgi:hypothetical protein
MKNSQTFGVIACLALIISCFLPWIFVEELNTSFSGINGWYKKEFSFGIQIKPHSFFCILSIILFCVNKIWCKRANMFVAFINLCWAIKNYIIFSMCRPSCPQVKIGLYLLVFFAFAIQIMAFLPTTKVNENLK